MRRIDYLEFKRTENRYICSSLVGTRMNLVERGNWYARDVVFLYGVGLKAERLLIIQFLIVVHSNHWTIVVVHFLLVDDL